MNIKEVSQQYDLTQDTLRYYERIGLIPTVNRSSNGNRDYTETDLRWVEFVKCMRGAGLSIEVIAEYMNLVEKGDSTLAARKELLTEQRDLLLEKMKDLQVTLDKLNYKIESYENNIAKIKLTKKED